MASPVYRFRFDGKEKLIQDVWVALASNPQMVEYHGIAKKGKLTSDAEWWVEKFAYDSNGFCTSRKSTDENQIMDNYLTLTYA